MENITEAETEFMYVQLGTGGSFHTALVRCIMSADTINRLKLSLGFRETVEVVNRFQNEAGYWEDLQARWKLREVPSSNKG